MGNENWRDLRLPDQIMAHNSAFPQDFLKVNLPSHLRDMYLREAKEDSCLMTGERAFEMDIISTTATWKMIRALERRVQSLETSKRNLERRVEGNNGPSVSFGIPI